MSIRRRNRPQPPAAAPAGHPELVIELHGVRRTLGSSVRLAAEAAIVPALLFAVVLNTAGLGWAILASLGWTWLVLAVRRLLGHPVPGVLVLSAGMFHGRALVAVLGAGAAVYLVQPLANSVVMAVLFLGSALIGRPVTVRLARDFVHVPPHVLARAEVHRVFTQVAVVWGCSRVLDAALTTVMMCTSTGAALLSRSLFSPLLTAATICVCTTWGICSLRRHGVVVRRVAVPGAGL